MKFDMGKLGYGEFSLTDAAQPLEWRPHLFMVTSASDLENYLRTKGVGAEHFVIVGDPWPLENHLVIHASEVFQMGCDFFFNMGKYLEIGPVTIKKQGVRL